jgi:hypothetical protein
MIVVAVAVAVAVVAVAASAATAAVAVAVVPVVQAALSEGPGWCSMPCRRNVWPASIERHLSLFH